MNEPPFSKKRRILVVDGNQAICAEFKRILRILQPEDEGSAGFELDAAAGGAEGLARVGAALAAGRPYALAFVEVQADPGGEGGEALARICQCDPDLQMVICTAGSDRSWEEAIEPFGGSDRWLILKKPFDPVEVLQLARVLAKKWELGRKGRLSKDELAGMIARQTRELQAAREQLGIETTDHAQAEEFLRPGRRAGAAGQIPGDIAHDFNNLLTVIQGYVECLNLEMPQNANVAEALREIDDAAKRATQLTAQMLSFSGKKTVPPPAGKPDEQAVSRGPSPALARVADGIETILLVEDELPVCRLARTLLQRQGYRVYEAGSGAEALAVWKARGSEIDLLLTDMIMPGGMTGRELAEAIRADRNDLKIIYTTGYSPEEFRQSLPLKEGLNFLAKPYHPDQLVKAVRHCLAEPAPVGSATP